MYIYIAGEGGIQLVAMTKRRKQSQLDFHMGSTCHRASVRFQREVSEVKRLFSSGSKWTAQKLLRFPTPKKLKE